MIIQYLSDLHFEFGSKNYLLDKIASCESDVLVIAGDLHSSKGIIQSLHEFSSMKKHIIFIPGNHEYYHSTKQYVDDQLTQFDDHPYIHVLNNDVWEYDNVVFIGSTGWWTMNAAKDAVKLMNDYIYIHDIIPANNGLDWGWESYEFFRSNLAKYDKRLTGKTIVCVSHNAPSILSIDPEFEGDSLNPCFANNWQNLIFWYKPDFWIHGHMHSSKDYKLDDTRVIANSYGYEGHSLNKNFEVCKTITI